VGALAARADAQDRAAAAQVVDRAGDIREQVGIAIAGARDEVADLDVRRVTGHGREQ
jgi:hypothetical protein